ncbi:hypothetical protein A2291_06205 [candidate division WOR-1 bacterium RIFOXYB2_FULL_42_35]|uniref:Four helix bundle protein n=1 Tax=candidate division WOR-1 bacterium RIFOXYC2_FULL_41_25 TaxID=1802586 RepID=A0A1F4TIS5_UNCSA|nr:MAG: hypothetical protein A2247_07865 [candidate division WOR-1 bacterium RIFOXYA2_FULL_41_14]OGC21638.1 MAG: hypothetical protein A2291_06205 [candidate division WOR-1 bacterium RIFOXYB2_FULL_42_35]OGC32641.1 MAG: hypothetical protein A2462_01965 [candidate division WOR-1 bacterium RIFOXYC2_FULL_41_25]OGC41499.1 MAG: hypothetical protein A2548_04245 [candidate division WOR-1 bacterium RIFOXYD2_FULL_41_8]
MKNNRDLHYRLLRFAKKMLGICKSLPKIPECEAIRKQLAKSATSVGANYEKADGALTKKNFVNKIGISRKEAKEVKFWLRTIAGVFIRQDEIVADIREAEEIIRILSAILIKCGVRPWR